MLYGPMLQRLVFLSSFPAPVREFRELARMIDTDKTTRVKAESVPGLLDVLPVSTEICTLFSTLYAKAIFAGTELDAWLVSAREQLTIHAKLIVAVSKATRRATQTEDDLSVRDDALAYPAWTLIQFYKNQKPRLYRRPVDHEAICEAICKLGPDPDLPEWCYRPNDHAI